MSHRYTLTVSSQSESSLVRIGSTLPNKYLLAHLTTLSDPRGASRAELGSATLEFEMTSTLANAMRKWWKRRTTRAKFARVI